MVTVAEKQRDIQQRFGISNQKFAELFQEQTGRRLGPELMGQDYDALRKAKIGSAQSFAEQAVGTVSEVAGTIGGAIEQVGRAGLETIETIGDYGSYMLGLADEEENRFARLDKINEDLKRLSAEQDKAGFDPQRMRQINEAQKKLAREAKRTKDELPALSSMADIADTYAKEAEDLKTRDFLSNAGNDLQEFIEAFPILFKEMATITDTGGSLSTLERITSDRASEGRDMGKGLISGAFGVTALVVSRLVGATTNAIKGEENAFDSFFELFNARPLTVLTTLTPMRLKFRKMASAGDAKAMALLKKMEARGIMKSLDAAEDATRSVLKQLDEAPSRAIAKATGGRFMPQKQRAQVVGKTEDAPTASGLFEADATTTPLRITDVTNAALRGAGYGLLAGEPGVGAAIGSFIETALGVGRNSKRFNEVVAAVGRYMQTINVGRTVSEQVAKQQLTDDAAKIRDFLESRGLPLRALAEEGRLIQRQQPAQKATPLVEPGEALARPTTATIQDSAATRAGEAISPIYQVDELGLTRRVDPGQGERIINLDDVRKIESNFQRQIDELKKAEAQFETSLVRFGDEVPARRKAVNEAQQRIIDRRKELERQRDLSIETAQLLADNQRMLTRDLVSADLPSPLSRDAARIVSEMGSELEKVGVSANRVSKLRETITDIGNGGISLLRSEKFLNLVLDELVSGLGKKQRATARKELSEHLSSVAEIAYAGGRRIMPVVRVSGQQIDLIPTISKVLESLDSKKKGGLKNRRKVESEVVAKAVYDESINAMGKARSRAMNMEAARPLIASGIKASDAIEAVRLGKVELDDYARSILSRSLEGESIPQVLPRNIEVRELASAIARLKSDGDFVGQMTRRRRRGASQDDVVSSVARRADDIVDDLINRFAEETFNYRSRVDNMVLGTMFEKVTPKTARDILKDLNDDGAITNPALRKQMTAALEASGARGVFGSDAPIKGRVISNSLQSTLNLLDDIQHSASAMNQIFNYMKMNLTVYRLATGVNNLLSNVWFQGIRRGDPIGVMIRGTKLARQYKRYTEGKYKPANPMEANIFRQIEESGVAKTNLLDAELDVIAPSIRSLGQGARFGGVTKVDKAKAVGKKAVEVAMLKKPLEAFYRLGDNIFKIEEMHTAMRSLYKDLDTMKVGDFVEFRTAPKTFARITRKQDGFYQGKRKLGDINDRRVAKILGAAGRRSAVDMFVDYSSRPGLVRKLQNLGPLSMVSPFLTWHFKAMGMGEKGFMSRALMPDALISRTNNKSIATRQSNQLLTQMLRRQAITAEARREMDEDRRYFKEMMAYIPGETRATIFADIADPRYTRAMYLGGQDFMSSEATKIAMIGRVIGLVGEMVPSAGKELIEEGIFGLGDDAKKGREIFQKKKEAGSTIGLISAGRLLGLAGQPLVEELMLILTGYRHRGGKADINGTPMSTPEILKRYGAFALPATSRILGEELLRQTGVIDEQNKASDRWKTFNPTDPAGHERASEFLIRQLFGIGFKPVALTGDKGAMTRYLNRAERVLNTSFNEAIKQTIERAKDDPDYDPDVEELRRLKTKAVTIGAEIKKQVMEDYATVVEGKLKRSSK